MRKSWKKIALAFLSTALVTIGLVGGLAVLSKGETAVSADVASNPTFEANFTAIEGEGISTTQLDGYTKIEGLDAERERVYLNTPVTLEGLSVSFYSSSVSGSQVGFYFGSPNDTAAYWNETVNTTKLAVINYQNPNNYAQDRLLVTTYRANDILNSSSIVYYEAACKNRGFHSNSAALVCDRAENALIGYTVTFARYDDFVYAVTVKMTHGSMWDSNANYNGTTKTSTAYLPKSALDGVLVNGKVRLYFARVSTNANSLYVKVNNPDLNHGGGYDTAGIFGGYSYAGASLSVVDQENRYTRLSGFTDYTSQAARFLYTKKVPIDGLSVSMKVSTSLGYSVGDGMGFILTGRSDGNVWYGYNENYASVTESMFAVTAWKKPYNDVVESQDQDRLQIATNHDYNYRPIIYNKPTYSTLHTGNGDCGCGNEPLYDKVDKTLVIGQKTVCTQRNFGNNEAHTYVVNGTADTIEYTVAFRVYNNSWYAIDIQCSSRHQAQPATNGVTTVYLPKSALNGVVDEYGYVYVMFGGFTKDSTRSFSADVKVSNANVEKYIEKYEEAIISGESANTIAAYRAFLGDALMTLSNRQRMAYHDSVLALDEKRIRYEGLHKTISMTVDSDLIVNHYIYVPKAVGIDGESDLQITWSYGEESEALPITQEEITQTYSFNDPVTQQQKQSSKDFIKYSFYINKLRPQCMTDIIGIEFIANEGEGDTLVHTKVKDWTMKKYLESFISGAVDTKLEMLVVDLLDYGAAAQAFMGHQTDKPANATYSTAVEESTLTGDVGKGVTAVSKTNIEGENEVKFTSATLILRDKVTMRAKLTVANLLDGETGAVITKGSTYAAGLTATAEIGGTVYDAVTGEVMQSQETLTSLNATGTQYLYLLNIKPTQYDETVTFKVYKGETVVATLTYSVNSYVAKKYNVSDADGGNKNAKLTQALWAVGYSAKAYVTYVNSLSS